jgi:hypothetical protein
LDGQSATLREDSVVGSQATRVHSGDPLRLVGVVGSHDLGLSS